MRIIASVMSYMSECKASFHCEEYGFANDVLLLLESGEGILEKYILHGGQLSKETQVLKEHT